MSSYLEQTHQAYVWLDVIDKRLTDGTLDCPALVRIIKELSDELYKMRKRSGAKDWAAHASLQELRESVMQVYRRHCGCISVTPIKPSPGYELDLSQPTDPEE